MENNKIVVEFVGHTDSVLCGSFFKVDMIAASGSKDNTVGIWNFVDHTEKMVLKAHNSIVNSIKFIENKNFLASVEKDCKIIIWKLTDHSKYALLSGHSDYINEILIIKDEKFIISYDFKDGIKIWDIDKKQENNLFTDQKQALKWLEENRFEMDLVERYLKI